MKFAKLSLAAIMAMGIAANAADVKVDGDVKVYYGTNDADQWTGALLPHPNGVQDDGTIAGDLFGKENSYANAAFRIGLTAEGMPADLTGRLSLTYLDTFGLENSIVNDVWGLRADAKMAEAVARHDAYLVLMHNRSQPARAEIREKLGGRYVGMTYEDLLEDVRRELMESVALAHEAEIPDEHLLLDPGIGFGKTVEQNLRLLNHLDEIKSLGYPVLVGPSRKSFIGYTLDLPPEERLEGTAAAVAIAIAVPVAVPVSHSHLRLAHCLLDRRGQVLIGYCRL
jgi:hypothetical protein